VYDSRVREENFSERQQIHLFLETWSPEKLWIPKPIGLHFEAGGRKRQKTDRIYYNEVGPIISHEAVHKLHHLLEREGHILPLKVVNADEKFYLWWVPWVENSVDFEASEKFPNGKTIKHHAFNASIVSGLTAFRPHFEGMRKPEVYGNVLVSDEFRQVWLDAGLTGIAFKPA